MTTWLSQATMKQKLLDLHSEIEAANQYDELSVCAKQVGSCKTQTTRCSEWELDHMNYCGPFLVKMSQWDR